MLHSDVPGPLDVRGEARRSPADPDMPAVGDEVAAARALRQLADRLLEMASSDLRCRGPSRFAAQLSDTFDPNLRISAPTTVQS